VGGEKGDEEEDEEDKELEVSRRLYLDTNNVNRTCI